jgi:hypothetical protein
MDYLKDTFFPIRENGEQSNSQNGGISSSHLIEPNVKYILHYTLQKCHDHRSKIYNFIFNICILTIFAVSFSLGLYYCYRNKLTPEERHNKMVRDQNYILSKIRFYQNEKMKKREIERTSNINDLPIFIR